MTLSPGAALDDRGRLILLIGNAQFDGAAITSADGQFTLPLRARGPSAPGEHRSWRLVVAFGEEHCFPEPGWAQALIDAHREDYAAVGPAMHNANPDTIVS